VVWQKRILWEDFQMLNVNAICKNKIKCVAKAVSGFLYSLTEANRVQQWDECSTKAIIINIHMNIKISYNKNSSFKN